MARSLGNRFGEPMCSEFTVPRRVQAVRLTAAVGRELDGRGLVQRVVDLACSGLSADYRVDVPYISGTRPQTDSSSVLGLLTTHRPCFGTKRSQVPILSTPTALIFH
jgi:hypothetical protein